MYFSEKRKQGLGSLRPGYFLGGTIGKFLLGNALNWGINKGIDYATKTPQQREDEKLAETFRRLGIQPYISEDTSGDQKKDDKKSSTFKGRIGSGILSLLATALLGPLAGPLVLRAGKGLMNRRNQMSLTDDSIITPGPIKTGGGDPNQIQRQEPTTSQGQAIDPSDLVSITDDSGQDTGFSEYSSPEVASSYEGSFRYGGIASLYR